MCDDNAVFCQQLVDLLVSYFHQKEIAIPEIAVFHSGETLLRDRQEKDIVFLDIEMPGGNGIQVGEKLMQQNKKTIIMIISSFEEYLDDAMRFRVYRYLSKPLDPKRFYRNMDDALYTYQSGLSACVPIETPEGTYLCDTEDIIMVETVGRKLVFYTTKGEWSVYGTIQKWLDVLNSDTFYRCHRSTIINLFHVTSLEHDRVILNHGRYEGYVAKRKAPDLKKAWLQFLAKK